MRLIVTINYGNMTAGSHVGFFMKLGVLTTIYMGKPEILVGKLFNGSCYFVWEASENIGCDLRQFNFSTLFSLFS